MPREDGEFETNLLKRQLEMALATNASLVKENEELRQEVIRLKAHTTTLRAHSQERKSLLWKKLQNSNDPSIEKSTTEKHQHQSEQELEKKDIKPIKAPNPPPVPSRAPPPPPMPSKALVGPRAIHRVPELMELYRSLTRQNSGQEAKPGQAGKAPAVALTKNMIGEIENRSTYITQVKSEVETRADFINLLIKEVESSAHEKISEVEAFVSWVDEQLSKLVDERAVLRHFPRWPERKADTLREAAFCYRDLASLNCEVSSFEDDPRESLARAARRVQDLQDRLERSVSNVERTREGTSKRYRDFKIPWDWMTDSGLIGEMKLNSLRLAREFMKRVTKELKSTREEDNLLLQGVRFAHRVHQFAGGFDVQTTQAFQELKRVGLGYATK